MLKYIQELALEGAFPAGQHLALSIQAHDATFGRDRMNDTHGVKIEQSLQFGAQWEKRAGLHLDQFLAPHQVDYEAL